jgi:hypothetical protein
MAIRLGPLWQNREVVNVAQLDATSAIAALLTTLDLACPICAAGYRLATLRLEPMASSNNPDMSRRARALLRDMQSAICGRLSEVAPEGYRFGEHPSDSSRLGFWPVELVTC